MWELLAAVAAGFVVAALGTSAGVSGAVFLLPIQISVLGVTGPAVSATNLLFNIVSTPLALHRLTRRRPGQRTGHAGSTGSGHPAARPAPNRPPGSAQGPPPTVPSRRLAWAAGGVGLVIAAGVPSAVLGAYLRVTVLADPGRFRILVAVLLLPMGVHLLWRALRNRPQGVRPTSAGTNGDHPTSGPPASANGRARAAGLSGRDGHPGMLFALASVAAVAGGILGIGGGSLLAPALVAIYHYAARDSAVLALAVTLTTSVTGLISYTMFDLLDVGAKPATPYWTIGLALGLGGLVGGLVGTSLQDRLSDRLLTVILGSVATLTAASYLLRT